MVHSGNSTGMSGQSVTNSVSETVTVSMPEKFLGAFIEEQRKLRTQKETHLTVLDVQPVATDDESTVRIEPRGAFNKSKF